MRTLALMLCLSSVAHAQERPRPDVESYDLWSEPNPGLRYLKRVTTAPVTIHVLALDLTAPGVEIVASPRDQRWSTVAEVAREGSFAAAVNGGFWHSMAQPGGLQIADGELWEVSKDDLFYGYFGITKRGRAVISPPGEVAMDLSRLEQAVSARPMLVHQGEVTTENIDVAESANRRQPRTAVGISANGRRVWLLVTDGRQDHSVGMTLYEVARTLEGLGAERAINLDGGGSSTIYVERLGGVINAPSGGRWEQALGLGAVREQGRETGRVRRRNGREMVYVRGVEREVMNVLAIRAPAGSAVIGASSAPLNMPLDMPEVIALPPRPPTVRLGVWREWLPSLAYGVVLCALLLLLRYRVRRV